MPNIAKMQIISCRGDHCDYVEFTVPDDYKYLDDFYGGDLCYEYRGRILEDANYPITAKCGDCGDCGDNRYSVRFIEWIEWVDPNGNTNCLAGMACPECNHYEDFDIVATCVVHVEDDGTDECRDFDWDDDSTCTCRLCGFAGEIRLFKE